MLIVLGYIAISLGIFYHDMLAIDRIITDLLSQKFCIIENFFAQDLLQLLHDEIYEIDQNNNLRRAGIGRNEDYLLKKEIRKDKIKWIDNSTPAQRLLFQNLEDLRQELNKHLMLGLFDFESHFAVYNAGDFYRKHFDSFRGAKNRIISLVIYLNKEWQQQEGGLLNIYQDFDDEKPFISLLPKWGNAVLFLSEEIAHEVTTTHKTRYSIATWFRVRELL